MKCRRDPGLQIGSLSWNSTAALIHVSAEAFSLTYFVPAQPRLLRGPLATLTVGEVLWCRVRVLLWCEVHWFHFRAAL